MSVVRLYTHSCLLYYIGCLKHLYALRANADPDYGAGKNKQTVSTIDYNLWEKAVASLDQNDPTHMQMLILILCGTFFALRGNTEHANLELKHIEYGDYPPNSDFAGLKFIGLTNLLDKSHQLRYVIIHDG